MHVLGNTTGHTSYPGSSNLMALTSKVQPHALQSWCQVVLELYYLCFEFAVWQLRAPVIVGFVSVKHEVFCLGTCVGLSTLMSVSCKARSSCASCNDLFVCEHIARIIWILAGDHIGKGDCAASAPLQQAWNLVQGVFSLCDTVLLFVWVHCMVT